MDYDVIVVGGGNAALCAALSASESAKKVLVLERAPEEESGGNSRFTAGLFRLAYTGADDLKTLIPDLSAEEIANTDFGTYTEEQFLDDMARVTEYRCDPDLTEILVKQSLPTAQWMRKRGVRFTAAWGRQAFKIGGKFKFWGGLTVEAVGGGPGLVESLTQIAKKTGIEIWYGARAISLIADDDGRSRRRGQAPGENEKALVAAAVVLAAGGFQANTEWRTRYMGPGWELAKVRGTRFNTGDAIRMALDIGAAAHGNWSGCHAVAWDRNAPETGDLAVGDGFQKHSYPVGRVHQRRRQALRRRGRGLPQLHLRQVRPRDPAAAQAVRLADLRRQGEGSSCATSTASSRSPRSPPTRSRSWSRSWTTPTRRSRSRR